MDNKYRSASQDGEVDVLRRQLNAANARLAEAEATIARARYACAKELESAIAAMRKVYFVPDPYAPECRYHIGTLTTSGYQVADICAMPATREQIAIVRLAEAVLRDWRDMNELPPACSAHIQWGE